MIWLFVWSLSGCPLSCRWMLWKSWAGYDLHIAHGYSIKRVPSFRLLLLHRPHVFSIFKFKILLHFCSRLFLCFFDRIRQRVLLLNLLVVQFCSMLLPQLLELILQHLIFSLSTELLLHSLIVDQLFLNFDSGLASCFIILSFCLVLHV